MTQEFRTGDHVTWNRYGGTAADETVRRIAKDTQLVDRQGGTSTDDLEYLVRSESSGGEAVHKPSALKKRG